jgi:hypothetical protein
LGGDAAEASATMASTPLSGIIKGRWKVVRKIGAGAFGEIFQGRNVVTSEDVAIKGKPPVSTPCFLLEN